MNITTVESETGTNTWTWTCPAGINARILWLHCIYTSDATVANRQLVMELLNGSDALRWDTHAGGTQAASLVRHYSFLVGIYRETSFLDGEIQIAMPKILIPEGFKLRIRDTGDASSSDSMAINFQFKDEK